MPSATDNQMERLEPFVGRWTMAPSFADVPPVDTGAWTTFQWMPGGRFLVQRWEVPVPEAPDGLAVIGYDEGRAAYLQHYFDSRGVARVYEMGLEDGVWTLSRTEADFSSLEFQQRWTGTFGLDGNTITGRWEICHDGATWELDFELRYQRVT